MTNLKRIESQARGRIEVVSYPMHWLDEMKTLRDNHSNELEKIIDNSLKRYNPFKPLKFKGVDIPRDGWETDRNYIHFQFWAELSGSSEEEDIILQGGCAVWMAIDYDPKFDIPKKILKSKVDIECLVQLADREDGRPDSVEKDLRLVKHNLTYGDIL